MQPVVLFRKSIDNLDEIKYVEKYFRTVYYRTEVPVNSTVIGRYACLPYYRELEHDLKNYNCELINSYEQHMWIANFEYYEVLKDYTFPSWHDYDFHKCKIDGPFVVKGKTNSHKFQWNTSMYAENKHKAYEVAGRINEDPSISFQGIIYRQYVPLKTIEIGANDLPFANEYRLFFYKNKLLSYGYYWTNSEYMHLAKINNQAFAFAQEIANIAQEYTNFYCLDIAEKEEGGWILVEINDAQQSGLSDNSPDILFSNLKDCFEIESKLKV